MGIRFRKSIKIAPGVRINLSKSGVSATLGPKGASIGVGRRGVFANLGIPGSGVFYRKKLGTPWGGRGGARGKGDAPAAGSAGLQDAEALNAVFQDAIDIYRQTEAPSVRPVYVPRPYDQPEPVMASSLLPLAIRIGLLIAALAGAYFTWGGTLLLWAVWEGYSYYSRRNTFQSMKAEWEAGKALFDREEVKRAAAFDEVASRRETTPEEVLETVFDQIAWPRETEVSFQVDGEKAFLDVDLPEVEDMPDAVYSYSKQKGEIVEKTKTDTQVRKEYARHIHGVGFLLLGETFRTLPRVREVVLSAFSQRTREATGKTEDDYLYSVRVFREQWEGLNFVRLDQIDPVAALEGFELVRDMTKTCIFKPIVPLSE